MLERAIAKGPSVRLSVNQFVFYTIDSRLNSPGCRNIFHIVR